MRAIRSDFTRSQLALKKAGPKPSGPGLALEFMARMAAWISSKEKGLDRDRACEVVSWEPWKRSRRSNEKDEGEVVPSKFEK